MQGFQFRIGLSPFHSAQLIGMHPQYDGQLFLAQTLAGTPLANFRAQPFLEDLKFHAATIRAWTQYCLDTKMLN